MKDIKTYIYNLGKKKKSYLKLLQSDMSREEIGLFGEKNKKLIRQENSKAPEHNLPFPQRHPRDKSVTGR